ncbi:polyprenyl diphosphate synthase [Candidatus Protochlamydia phocaeensis]|uniref:polyprenyl diphosphate synthase n=1 Tax=Candidatus Protochlamydia phocaeensis TaxID=1414722 RepID=UPI00083891DE|nr:polyprenyl diphosphate synthase [Candidatus Protochlamydia phocaeensis]
MSVDMAVMPFQEKSTRFHPAQLARLDRSRIPRHIAIIPDGNRRWAKKRLSSANEGHREGADILMEVVKAAKELNVKGITFFCFSTENWTRPAEEIMALMVLFSSYLTEHCEEMVQNGIKLETIGELNSLPPFLRQTIHDTKMATQECDKIRLILALNYGARNELCRAFKAMLQDYDRKHFSKDDINEETISRYLDTHDWQDPELLIRTSGELRISNFLLWQISYTEIYISPVLWPDFSPQHLLEAILDYQERDRRLGGN